VKVKVTLVSCVVNKVKLYLVLVDMLQPLTVVDVWEVCINIYLFGCNVNMQSWPVSLRHLHVLRCSAFGPESRVF
jgi:hypothetical protein